MCSFQESIIQRSLCRFKGHQIIDQNAEQKSYRKQLHKLSIDIFRNILIFTDVIQTGHNGDKIESARFVLNCGQSHCLLRDEIYTQILKQLCFRFADSAKRKQYGLDGVAVLLGFKLLYLCLRCFGSSQEMALILLSRICNHCPTTTSNAEKSQIQTVGFCAFRNIGEIATNCYKAWHLMVKYLMKQKDPGSVSSDLQLMSIVTDEQIEHILFSKALPVRLEVYLPDDTRIRLNVHSFCTMDELVAMVCAKFGFKEWIKDFTVRIRANVEGFVVRTNSNLFTGNSQVIHWYGRWKDIVKKHPIMRWKIYVKFYLHFVGFWRFERFW